MLAELKHIATRWLTNDHLELPAWGGVTAPPLEAARDWLLRYSSAQGLFEHHHSTRIYPEVTGYTIPTLLDIGERELACSWAHGLVDMQLPCGALPAPGSQLPYVFDTGQVIRGWLALLPQVPELSEPVGRACDWLVQQQETSGRIPTPDNTYWATPDGKTIPEAVHLYCLWPLRQAGLYLGIDRYTQAADEALTFYAGDNHVKTWQCLSHFTGYIAEALIELGRLQLANALMDSVEQHQRPDGSIPAYPEVSWICSTGLAQLALAGYKLGRVEFADRAVACLCRRQHESGGFVGSWGPGASYFVDQQIAWAVKYFIDAAMAGIQADFEANVQVFPTDIKPDDGRLISAMELVASDRSLNVLDAGCGRGRFLTALKTAYPQHRYTGMDLADGMLTNMPDGVTVCTGSLLRTPFDEATFDRVLCVEALEHSIFAANAVRELCRITKPGGRVLIVDKTDEHWGVMQTKPWERWFGASEVCDWLSRYCDDITVEPVSHGGRVRPDDLLLAWRGRVR